MTEQYEISLSDAAQQLGMSWGRAWRLVLTGELSGTKRQGRWVVSKHSVSRLRDGREADGVRSVGERLGSDRRTD